MKKCALVCLAACLGWGQAGHPLDTAPAFDVTSVRPNVSGTGNGGSLRGGLFRLQNASLKTLLMMGYQVKPYQVIGGPGWMSTDTYDVEAKTEKDITFAESYPMIQTMLADRFQLRLHRETRDLPVYELVPAKSGVRLLPPGDDRGFFRIGRGLIEAKRQKMQILADLLSGALGRMVLDKTGRAGDYDFKLQWTPDDSQPNATNADVTGFDPAGPSIFTAVQEQLGLRLESAKAPTEVLVIDHVEKPSEN